MVINPVHRVFHGRISLEPLPFGRLPTVANAVNVAYP
jgi:hypothetical protein